MSKEGSQGSVGLDSKNLKTLREAAETLDITVPADIELNIRRQRGLVKLVLATDAQNENTNHTQTKKFPVLAFNKNDLVGGMLHILGQGNAPEELKKS